MILLCRLISIFSFLLLSAFGAVASFATPGDWQQFSYPIEAQDLVAQHVKLTNTARAPPTTNANVVTTGTALAQTGDLRALDEVETTGAVYALLRSSIAPNRTATQYPDGTFSVSDWTGYPSGVPRPPEGTTYRLLTGSEYTEARRLANNANAQLRRSGVVPEGHEIHEIVPVKYGGSPTDPANKVYLPRGVHRSEVTPWWNRLQRDLEQ